MTSMSDSLREVAALIEGLGELGDEVTYVVAPRHGRSAASRRCAGIVGALLALALALAVVEIVTAYRRAARAVAS